jgi:hypothetical protein
MVAMQTTLGTTPMQDTAVKYGSFMEALMDSAQTADYWPVDYLPSPTAQAWLWDVLINGPVTLAYSKDQPPEGHDGFLVMPARKDGHIEEAYSYGYTVWYRCGMDNPVWHVLTALDR